MLFFSFLHSHRSCLFVLARNRHRNIYIYKKKENQPSTNLSVFTERWQTCEATRCHNQARMTDTPARAWGSSLTTVHDTGARHANTDMAALLGAAGWLPSCLSYGAASELSERFRRRTKTETSSHTGVISTSPPPR